MRERGRRREVANPAAIDLTYVPDPSPGTVLCHVLSGLRSAVVVNYN